jgi:hypothetical protein
VFDADDGVFARLVGEHVFDDGNEVAAAHVARTKSGGTGVNLRDARDLWVFEFAVEPSSGR